MKVLVTGGSGVVGTAVVRHLLARGHRVRLFARHAERDAREWPERVEPHRGSVTSGADVRGSASGCDAIIHIAGIAAESPPDETFEAVNVDGTRRVLDEATRAGVRRFVYVSSLGAERGTSDYHASKRRAEALVRAWGGEWVICRPGNVYGPGDEVISLLLRMVRTLPMIPIIGDGDQPFQPIWHEDLGEALARAVDGPAVARRALDLAGTEVTTPNGILDRLERITDRRRPRVPLPGWLAMTGAKLAGAFGVDVPVNENEITMLIEHNVIPADRVNALTDVLGITPTPLADGLRALADALPEQLPAEGTGRMMRREYRADIVDCRCTPESVFALVRDHFGSLVPSGTIELAPEPGTPYRFREGETVTMALPLRGTIQVRVEELTDRSMTCVTLEGHPLAGAVRFLAEPRGDAVRFAIQTYDRPASLVDLAALAAAGVLLKHFTWAEVVEHVVDRSGGRAPDGVQVDEQKLSDEETAEIEAWLRRLIEARERAENRAAIARDRGAPAPHGDAGSAPG